MLLLPGLGTVARTAMHCAAADVSIQHFGAARDFRMETVGFLLPSHMNPARRAGSSWSTSGLPMRLRDGFRGRAIALGRAPGAGPSRRRIAKWGCSVPQQTTGREVAKPIGVAKRSDSCPHSIRLAVRQISDRSLSEQERIAIADLRRNGVEYPADRLQAWPGAVDRIEGVAPQQPPRRPVRGFEAHRGAVQRRARRHAADRLEPCPMRPDRRPARSTVEPATDRPASSLPRRGDLYAVLNFLVVDIRGLVISIRR